MQLITKLKLIFVINSINNSIFEMKKTCVLLINLGTPDSPSVKDVRKYLFEFLNDPRVIDINPIGRFFLVNFIIVPFRAPKSAKIYKQLWTDQGSPIIIYGESVKKNCKRNWVMILRLSLQCDIRILDLMKFVQEWKNVGIKK